MSRLISQISAGLAAANLDGPAILIACSGGADSTALLRGLAELATESGLQLHAAHLDHGLRADSHAESEWVADLCRHQSIGFIGKRIDVGQLAERDRTGIEEAARNARYEFLADAARKVGCREIALAHTADDQAETVLHHLLRGSGVAGLRGMPHRRCLRDELSVIRPLLSVRRSEVESYLSEIGQEFLTDDSNQDRRFTRNRIRHDLLPSLEEAYNPRVREALLRLAGQAKDIGNALEYVARGLLETAVKDQTAETVRLDAKVLAGEPTHLVRECFRLIWIEMDWPRQKMGFAEWDQLARLTRTTAAVTLPGRIDARRRGDLLVLTHREGLDGLES